MEQQIAEILRLSKFLWKFWIFGPKRRFYFGDFAVERRWRITLNYKAPDAEMQSTQKMCERDGTKCVIEGVLTYEWDGTVWPDVEIKQEKFLKKMPKTTKQVLVKRDVFKNCPRSQLLFGLLLK